jgi:branched-chain amino acid transport system substrate-binding protein
MRWRTWLLSALSLALTAGTVGIWGPATTLAKARRASAAPVVVGASIPVTGTFAAFGSYLDWGYHYAVDQVNAKGGVRVDGVKRKVKLIVLDDESNPTVTANNVQRLILQDHVAGLVSSCTPPLVNPGALVAERYRVPMVADCDPIASFEAAHHWTYVWDIFFYDPNLAETPFNMLKAYHIKTNHKVAIIADNSPDGLELGGKLWPYYAPRYGYKVVYNTSFPTGTTTFGNVIAAVKASGADIVLIDTDTPTAIDIRRQMKQVNFTPKMLVIEKGAEPEQYAQALGPLANGTLVGGYWSPKSPYPGAAALAATYERQTHATWSQHIADSYTAMLILLQAINRADSIAPAKVNAAIAQTNGMYVVGPIRFDHATSYAPALSHASALPLTEDQWQHGQIQVVYPKDRATAPFIYPEPGAK